MSTYKERLAEHNAARQAQLEAAGLTPQRREWRGNVSRYSFNHAARRKARKKAGLFADGWRRLYGPSLQAMADHQLLRDALALARRRAA